MASKSKGQGIDITITGDVKAQKRLLKLELKVQKKIVRKALRITMKPLLSVIRKEAPKDTGSLRRGIKLRAGKFPRRSGRIGVEIRTKRIDYAAAVEFGARGRVASKFMRRPFRARKAKMLQELGVEIGKQITAFVRGGG